MEPNQILESVVIPAGAGRAVEVRAGRVLRIEAVEGPSGGRRRPLRAEIDVLAAVSACPTETLASNGGGPSRWL